jgi:hypothetical protein
MIGNRHAFFVDVNRGTGEKVQGKKQEVRYAEKTFQWEFFANVSKKAVSYELSAIRLIKEKFLLIPLALRVLFINNFGMGV